MTVHDRPEYPLKRLIDEEYTRHPFYSSRKMVVYLLRCGHRVNRKRAQRLMRGQRLAIKQLLFCKFRFLFWGCGVLTPDQGFMFR